MEVGDRSPLNIIRINIMQNHIYPVHRYNATGLILHKFKYRFLGYYKYITYVISRIGKQCGVLVVFAWCSGRTPVFSFLRIITIAYVGKRKNTQTVLDSYYFGTILVLSRHSKVQLEIL